MNKVAWKAALPYVLFAITPFVVYPLGFVRSGLFDGGDDLLSNLPFLVHSAKKLLTFDVFWTPSLWLGAPLLGEPEFGTFYLPRLILLLGGAVPAFAAYVIFHYVLAQSGFYLYARAAGVSGRGAVFGALAYGFSGFMLGHRGHSMYIAAGAWAPFVLYFLARAARNPKKRYFLGAALSFAALPLSGAYQLTVYLAGLVVALAVLEALFESDPRRLVVPAIGLGSGLLLAAPQILPSLAYATELVSSPRHDFGVSTLLSYDPRLLPLLVIPEDPLASAELYSRIGGVVLVFALLGAVRWQPSVRAWTLVAATTLLLMLGKHVPLLPSALASLPVIGIFRGPVRHNFELGLATAVLAARGFDAAFGENGVLRRRWVWLSLAAGGMGVLAVAARVMMRSAPEFDGARAMLLAVRPWNIAVGVAALGAGTVAVAFSRTKRRALAFAVVLAPLAEAWTTTRALDHAWPDRTHALASLYRLDAPGRRFLPAPVAIGGLALMSENAALLLPNASALCGYASMAPSDASAMFDLDMLGHPRDGVTLAWSRLPSIFGVTHLILPASICEPLDVVADPKSPKGACAPFGTAVSLESSVECTHELGAGVSRYAVAADSLAGKSSFAVVMDGRGSDRASRKTVVFEPRREEWRRKWFAGTALPSAGVATVVPLEGTTLSAGRLALVEERLDTMTSMDGRASPGASEADTAFTFPEWFGHARRDEPRLRLYATARAVSPTQSGFVETVATDVDSDRAHASMEIDGARLGPNLGAFGKFIHVSRDANYFALRISASDGAVVTSAALYGGRRREYLNLVDQPVVGGERFGIGHGLEIDAKGTFSVAYHLPVRPVTVTVEAGGAGAVGAATLGVAYDDRLQIPGARRVLDGLERAKHASFTVEVPPETSRITLSAAGFGTTRVRVRAESACAERRYVEAETLDGGFVLYENRDAMPRAFAVSSVRGVGGVRDARRLLTDDATFNPRETALVEEPVPLAALGAGEVLATRFASERVEVRVRALTSRSTFLVVNDRFAPEWRATLDGVSTRIYRANGLVRGVVVPPGLHVVTMRYVPQTSFFIGAGLSLVGLALALGGKRLARWRVTSVHSS